MIHSKIEQIHYPIALLQLSCGGYFKAEKTKKYSNFSREKLLDQVVKLFDISTFKSREHYLVSERQCCMYVLRVDYGLTFKDTGGIFHKDHSNAMHAV